MQAWDEFIKKQELLLGKEVVGKWLSPLKVIHFDSGNLYLEARDSFQVLWFEEHIRPRLKKEFLNNNFRSIKVHLTAAERSSLPLPPKKQKSISPPPIPLAFDPLDPSCTFDNFIPGDVNEVVIRLLCEISGQHPETGTLDRSGLAQATFNPIYLFGPPASGKTHLLMALTHAFKKRGLNVLYARAETFTEHVVTAIRGSDMKSFREAYRNVDVLLIDDVHIFSRKHATQEEFFHTFNALQTSGRQIILSSKCIPASLEEIEPRLISRFEWGITLHLEKLDRKDLQRVLLKRCEHLHFPLSEDVLGFLPGKFPTCTALLQALDAMILRCHMDGDARYTRNPLLIDPEKAEHMLADLLAYQQKSAPSPEKIISAVAAVCGIRKEDLLGKSQTQECSLPRQIAMYLCRQELRMPFQKIGRIFSRDHSTVMTGVRQIGNRLAAADRELQGTLAEIRQRIP